MINAIILLSVFVLGLLCGIILYISISGIRLLKNEMIDAKFDVGDVPNVKQKFEHDLINRLNDVTGQNKTSFSPIGLSKVKIPPQRKKK